MVSYAAQNKFLMVVTDLESEGHEHSDPVSEAICNLKDGLDA